MPLNKKAICPKHTATPQKIKKLNKFLTKQKNIRDTTIRVAKSKIYLRYLISSSGTVRESLPAKMPSTCKVVAALRLQEAKLINRMVFFNEACYKISNKELTKLEEVNMALLTLLLGVYSKCRQAFILLEFVVLKFKHLIMIITIMFHHNLVIRINEELISKVYKKKK